MKKKHLSIALIAMPLFLISCISGVGKPKPINYYFADIEPLLQVGDYMEADKKYNKLNKDIKESSVGEKKVYQIYRETVRFLKTNSVNNAVLKDIDSSRNSFTTIGNRISPKKDCFAVKCKHIDKRDVYREFQRVPSELPFTQNFIDTLKYRHKENVDLYNKTYSFIKELDTKEKELTAKKKEEEIKQRLLEKREEEERRIKAANDRIAKEQRERERLEAKKRAFENAIKKAGYAGHYNKEMVRFIYETQKKGGLENYLNTVIGYRDSDNKSCGRWYSKIKVFQVVSNGVLYDFSEYRGREYLDFKIFVEKEPGVLYQEGQSLKNSFYLFTGMFSYITVLGVEKQIPAFKAVAF